MEILVTQLILEANSFSCCKPKSTKRKTKEKKNQQGETNTYSIFLIVLYRRGTRCGIRPYRILFSEWLSGVAAPSPSSSYPPGTRRREEIDDGSRLNSGISPASKSWSSGWSYPACLYSDWEEEAAGVMNGVGCGRNWLGGGDNCGRGGGEPGCALGGR